MTGADNNPSHDESSDSAFHKLLFMNLIKAPSVWLTSFLGANVALVGMATDSTTAAFTGVLGVLAGLGVAASRWIFKKDQLIEQTTHQLEVKQQEHHQQQLDDLDKQLRRDRDPRTQKLLRQLRAVHDTITSIQSSADNGQVSELAVPPTIKIKADQLFESCVKSLERSLSFGKAAKVMQTDHHREKTLASREQELAEVASSIERLTDAVDQIRSLEITKSTDQSRIAELRAELDESLNVAKRVEERMRSLEDDLQIRVNGRETGV